jgi:Flp pilus assembly protein TadG
MSSGISKIRNLLRGRRGSASLEFGLVVIPFVLMMMGLTDVSRYFATMQNLRTVIADAERAAVVSASDYTNDCSTILASVSSGVPLLSAPPLTICVTKTTASTGIVTISVTGTYPFNFLLGLSSWTSQSGTLSQTISGTY